MLENFQACFEKNHCPVSVFSTQIGTKCDFRDWPQIKFEAVAEGHVWLGKLIKIFKQCGDDTIIPLISSQKNRNDASPTEK